MAAATSLRRVDGVPAAPSPSRPSPPPGTLPPWVILCRLHKEDAVPEGASFLLTLAAPPRVSSFTFSRRSFVPPLEENFSPFVVSADDFGRRFLVVIGGGWPRLARDSRVAASPREDRSQGDLKFLICDASTGAAFSLPMDGAPIFHEGNLGIINEAEGDGFILAQLQEKALVRYRSSTGCWSSDELKHPLPAWWHGGTSVIAHEGRLWWVDLASGMFTCDPSAVELVTHFVPLPMAIQCNGGKEERFRCISVSDGKLLLVVVDTACESPTGVGCTVRRWALDQETGRWMAEFRVDLEEIWADASYKGTGLPERNPSVGLVDPTNPDVVLFFLDQHIFSVDLRLKRVLGCMLHTLPISAQDAPSSFVQAWQLPHSPVQLRICAPQLVSNNQSGITPYEDGNSFFQGNVSRAVKAFRLGITLSNVGFALTELDDCLNKGAEWVEDTTRFLDLAGEYGLLGDGNLTGLIHQSADVSRSVSHAMRKTSIAVSFGARAFSLLGFRLQRLHPDAQTGQKDDPPSYPMITVNSVEDAEAVARDCFRRRELVVAEVPANMDSNTALQIYDAFIRLGAHDLIRESAVLMSKVQPPEEGWQLV